MVLVVGRAVLVGGSQLPVVLVGGSQLPVVLVGGSQLSVVVDPGFSTVVRGNPATSTYTCWFLFMRHTSRTVIYLRGLNKIYLLLI